MQDVRLWADSARIDFAHPPRLARPPLAAQGPLPARGPRASATFETAFGVVERPTHRNTSWDQARFEVAGHRFADLSEPGYGVALLNDGRYGHHALGNELGLSLLRSPVWPDPLADEGEQELVYALLPHPGDWLEGGVLAEAEDLNRPLLARAVERGAGASLRPLRVDGPAARRSPRSSRSRTAAASSCASTSRRARAARVALDAPGRLARRRPARPARTRAGPPDPELPPFAVRSWRLRQAIRAPSTSDSSLP